MSTVPIPQGATVDQDSPPASGTVPIPQGATVDQGYSEHLNLQTGQTEYTYPQGQKAFSDKHPEMSTDDQGNVYYQGNKIDPKIGIVFPVGAGLPRSQAIPLGRAAGTAAGAIVNAAKSPLGQAVGKVVLRGAIKAAEYAIGIKLADLWHGL